MKSGKKLIQPKSRIIKYGLLLALLMSQLTISGCWNQNEVNNSAIPLAIGFDYKDNQAIFSMQIAKPTSQGSGSEESGGSGSQALVITGAGSNIIEADRRIMLSFPRIPIWAHAGTMVIGEGLAKKDLGLVFDFVSRNRNFRKAAHLYVFSGGTVDECFKAQLPLEPYSGPGLDKMVRNQEQLLGRYFPITTSKFEERLDNPGIDAYAPRVVVKNNMLALDGMAVFKGRKMAGVLNETESRGFRFLRPDQITGGILSVGYPPDNTSGQEVVLELIRSQATIKPIINANGITMSIKVNAEANFYGQNSIGNALTPKNIERIEQACNQQIVTDIKAAIKRCQALESDVFGWGQEIYRTQPAVWQEVKNDWPSAFSQVKTDIQVKLKIRRTFLTIRSFEYRR
jgi:spore germination protein KC